MLILFVLVVGAILAFLHFKVAGLLMGILHAFANLCYAGFAALAIAGQHGQTNIMMNLVIGFGFAISAGIYYLRRKNEVRKANDRMDAQVDWLVERERRINERLGE